MSRAALAAVALVAGCGGAPPARAPTPPADNRLDPGDHVATLDGRTLAYHVAGARGGRTCVVWPGGPGLDSAYLRAPALERDVRLVYVDPAGTGASSPLADPAGYNRARYAADLEALRGALGLDTLCLVGHSYGGFVALTYALAHPERVSHLVLYDTAARLDAELARAAAQNLERRRDRPWYAQVAAAFKAPVASDDDATRAFAQIVPAYLADWDGRGGELGPAILRSRASAAPWTAVDRAPYDVRAQLPSLRVPTLVLVGRHDFVCPPPFAEELARGIPGAKLQTFEHSGHLAHLEEPDAFAVAVWSFIR